MLRRPVCSYRLICRLTAFLLLLAGTLTQGVRANDTDSLRLYDAPPYTLPHPDTVAQALHAVVQADTLVILRMDTLAPAAPDPVKAIWYSALFPGLGQLYNKRYWKLPVVAAGVVGLSYAIGWNSKYYVAYTNAYRDISDSNPQTNSYLDLLPPGTTNFNTSQLTTILRNRQQKYRRSRDLSYIGAVGLYLICILDAYVDAELYDFDISPELTLTPTTTPLGLGSPSAVELRLSFRF